MKPTALFTLILFGVLASGVGAKDVHQTVCNPPEVECRAAEPTAAVEARKENFWAGNWVIKRNNAPDFLKGRAPVY
ncbi:hypothetical protein L226DRAFT_617257 [Lentinus tigrinus ALCF2SS1-7]|uniref:uncharacterized protein n=1 Tax=Lentinus tigrinus ALCF2SS1-7 TaxID=1328758 RepID=UPI001165EB44|nr:hypothetical protein L226DRAFT_617257 [Lentinus tigrinus ALCF2SS1-7]